MIRQNSCIAFRPGSAEPADMVHTFSIYRLYPCQRRVEISFKGGSS
jgi:hypothetical protein